MALFALGAPIGAWLGADIAGAVAKAYGWRAAFLVLGLPGVLSACWCWLTIREPQRGRLSEIAHEIEAPNFLDIDALSRAARACLHVMMGGGLTALWGWGLMWFTPTYFQRAYHLDVGQAGALLGPIHLMAGAAASLFTAWLLSRPAFADPRHVLWLLAGVTAAATIPSFFVYLDPLPGAGPGHAVAVHPGDLLLHRPRHGPGPEPLAAQDARAVHGRLAAARQSAQPRGRAAGSSAGSVIISPAPAAPMRQSLRLALLILAPSGFWAAWHYWRAGRNVVAEQAAACGG